MVIIWWKIKDLLMSTTQLYEAGLIGRNHQLKLWIDR